MDVNLEILRDLSKIALSGTHPRVWIAAALVYRNKVISYGINQMKTHPYQRRYGRNVDSIFWHAETAAIYTADKKLNFSKFNSSTIYIARVKYFSEKKEKFVCGLSLPCDGCLRCIQDYGIKSVIYTLDHVEGTKESFGILNLN